jgi:hypothetical protein
MISNQWAMASLETSCSHRTRKKYILRQFGARMVLFSPMRLPSCRQKMTDIYFEL